MKMIILSALAGLVSLSAKAQTGDADKKAIEKQVDAFAHSWNNHNFSDMETYTTADVDWVNVVGMFWKGRKQVEFAHQYFHDRMFKTTPLKVSSISIKMVTNDVAIAYVVSRAGSYTTPGGTIVPEGDSMASMVFVKKEGRWLLNSAENVPIDDRAKASNPVLHMAADNVK